MAVIYTGAKCSETVFRFKANSSRHLVVQARGCFWKEWARLEEERVHTGLG